MTQDIPTYEEREQTYRNEELAEARAVADGGDVCGRCGDAETAPGKCADYCSDCIEKIAAGVDE